MNVASLLVGLTLLAAPLAGPAPAGPPGCPPFTQELGVCCDPDYEPWCMCIWSPPPIWDICTPVAPPAVPAE
jgi:hypothetical protein